MLNRGFIRLYACKSKIRFICMCTYRTCPPTETTGHLTPGSFLQSLKDRLIACRLISKTPGEWLQLRSQCGLACACHMPKDLCADVLYSVFLNFVSHFIIPTCISTSQFEWLYVVISFSSQWLLTTRACCQGWTWPCICCSAAEQVGHPSRESSSLCKNSSLCEWLCIRGSIHKGSIIMFSTRNA